MEVLGTRLQPSGAGRCLLCVCVGGGGGGGGEGGVRTCMHKPVSIMYVNTSHRSRNRGGAGGPGGQGGLCPPIF